MIKPTLFRKLKIMTCTHSCQIWFGLLNSILTLKSDLFLNVWLQS